MNRARSNLIRAKTEAPGAYLEDLCFDAQQAAEKAIKAVLLARGVAFPYVHNLGTLLEVLEQAGEAVPLDLNAADGLTPYATVARYPNSDEPVTQEEYRRAVAIAEAVVAWAGARVATMRGRTGG